MLSQRKVAAQVDWMLRCIASAHRLGRFSRRGVRLAALSFAAACLPLAPAIATAQQTLYVSVNGGASGKGGTAGDEILQIASGGTQTKFATVTAPVGLAFDSNGNLFASNNSSGILEMITPTGTVTSAYGSGINYCYGLAIDSSNNVYMANEGSTITEYMPPVSPATTFTQSVFASGSAGLVNPYGLAFGPNGNLYVGDQGTKSVYELSPAGTMVSTVATGFSNPFGLAFDSHGDLFVSDLGTGDISEITPSGTESTFVSGLNKPFGLAFDSSGNLYEANFGDGSINEYSSTGMLLNTDATGLSYPTYIAFPPAPATGPTSGIEWTGTTSGTWSVGTNWTGGTAPGIAGATNATAISTDGALFDLMVTNTAVTVNAGRNVMNITFNTANVSSMTIGTTNGPALLLTSGGMIQITAPVVNPQVINAPLVLEGSYTFSNNSSTSAATLTVGGGITAAAASSVTTLTLSGTNTGANTLAGVLADGSGGAQLALAAQGGNWTLSGANTYSGGTTVSSGVLTIANTAGSGTGAGSVEVSSGSLIVTGSVSGTVTVTGGSATVNGSLGGSLNVTTGSALIAGSVAGTVTITSGTVTVNGSVAGPVTVNGGTLAGVGAISGALSVNSGGTLAPGASNNLTVNSTAGLASGSILSYTLSTPGVTNAGTSGGNTLTTINGALTLNPNETVKVAAGANFATGTYVLAHYTSLTDNSNNFSGWTVNGPGSNIYTFQIEPANKDVELVARPKGAPSAVQNLFVSVNGSASGGSNGGSGVTGNSVLEFPNGAAGTPIIYGAVSSPLGLGFDSAGNLYVGNNSSGAVYQIAPGTPPSTGFAGTVIAGPALHYSYGLAVDPSGNVYTVQDGTNPTLKLAAGTFTQSSFQSSISSPYGVVADSSGNIWISNAPGGTGGDIEEFSSSGTTIQTIGSGMSRPFGMAFDAGGDLYVADYVNSVVYKFTAGTWVQSTFLSSSDLGSPSAGVPFGVAVNAAGDVFVSLASANGSIEEFSPAGALIGTIASGLAYPTFMTFSGGATPLTAWTGATDTTWAGTGNWTGAVPGSTTGTINTDTATFNQDTMNLPLMIDMNRNVMNITFDNSAGTLNTTLTIGTTGGNALLLTDGGTIQITSSVTTPQIVNAPLVLEGTPGAQANSYNFINNSTTSAATLTFGGAITSGASNSVTTLNLAGTNTAANTIAGSISDGASGAKIALAVQGGTWMLTAANSYSGGTTIASGATLQLANSTGSAMTSLMNIVNSGSLVVAAPKQIVGTITGSGSVAVNGGSLTAYQIVQNSLTIGSGATVTLSPSGSGSTTNPTAPNNINFSSTLNSLTIAGTAGAWTGTLDIGNNGLVIQYGTASDPYSTIDNMIETGFDAAHWDGTGITSSLGRAAANSHTPLNIGLLDFTPGVGNFTNATFFVFEGQTVTTNAILIRLTYMDDIILAGDMTVQHAASDALIFAANYGTGTTWSVGDLTHTGLVGSADALLFAANYATGLASLDGTTGGAIALGGSETAAVPEPASAALAAFGALGLGLLACHRSPKKSKS